MLGKHGAEMNVLMVWAVLGLDVIQMFWQRTEQNVQCLVGFSLRRSLQYQYSVCVCVCLGSTSLLSVC